MQHDFIPYVTSRKNQANIDHREHLGEENKSRYRKHLLVDEIVLIKLNTKYPCKLTKLQSYKKSLSRPHTTGIAAVERVPPLSRRSNQREDYCFLDRILEQCSYPVTG